MSTLERAIAIAATAHAGQVDKAGAPYILHPLRVMLRVSSPEERMAAVLHDVVEDTTVTLQDLEREGFSPEVLAAVEALTKRKGETRLEAAARAKVNAIARAVKLADNAENMDLSRISQPTEKDHAGARVRAGAGVSAGAGLRGNATEEVTDMRLAILALREEITLQPLRAADRGSR